MVVVDLDVAPVYQSWVIDDAGGESAAEAGGIVEVVSSAAVSIDDGPAIGPAQLVCLGPFGQSGDVYRKIEGVFLGLTIGVSSWTEICTVDTGKAAIFGHKLGQREDGTVV
ncbi:MAG: hypothetical protein UX80_C0003G0051 [Candidatus Amesbacteria bacterium GW2011_GWA2_47_11b]|uniref:Uncharacterized protein n=1 Tax=Candidatus Amesbacteria bacterium GW2011_GWA2_47_11b TaxID=1618358 RepID=A0A0G1RMM3_9BACT|nr:MAG: hypothetical protein UX80_C0003G0051 [Candidatus Amesbacteria bacterium GW2011_GWA2_47_11b]